MNTVPPADPLQAANPAHNATVHASAGTGKTWLLVTRMIRLLLDGASPDSIMAITFTRKAAAEMQERLTERLRELMQADAATLGALLEQCGIDPDPDSRRRARGLYEQHLFNTYPLRTTTFHAFCQELLQRFPLEAGIPPGFEISESSAQLEQEAWEALFMQATRQPDSVLARALEQLIELCGGLPNTRSALLSFLAHRSDWWAYTMGRANATAWAGKQLTRLFGVSTGEDPLAGFPNDSQREQLQAYGELLGQNTATDRKCQGRLSAALTAPLATAERFALIAEVFLTKQQQPRKRSASVAQCKRLGEAGEQRLLELHEQFVTELLERLDRLARINSVHTTRAWYTAGVQLLDHYQRIKQERRLLDFSDLEWQACELLNRSAHANWIQYKLDKRIDHLLVDEFQDTNPTQWRLLLPLLEELAAGESERARTVFLVGDEKQSIYRFRRANPALLATASEWLASRLQARHYPLDKSRRSARAIIDCVNRVFGSGPLNAHISRYTPHATCLEDLYGRAEVLPLADTVAADPETPATGTGLRNPLQQPRQVAEDRRHYREGETIAAQIRRLLEERTLIIDEGSARTLECGDIMILVRQRTHVTAYERALRDAGIPYLGAGRGTLLQHIEIRDLEALLNTLISPYDNLALAQVLRCPVFGVTDNDLMLLAAMDGGTWYERLARVPPGRSPALGAACRLLNGWRELAGQIPVHDLLDRIYHEGEVLPRYEAAFPPALRPRVHANLTRFIELALEVDSGRYPSLSRFLFQLERLRRQQQDQPDEGTQEQADNDRVRLMTIHAAKGLESPVVFLADATAGHSTRNAYEALVDWPAAADRPRHFLLCGSKTGQDSLTAGLLEQHAMEDRREEANLLYVALTRARQFLFITGSASAKDPEANWYELIRNALLDSGDLPGDANPVLESGKRPAAAAASPAPAAAGPVDPRLAERIQVPAPLRLIAPSRLISMDSELPGEVDGRQRGNAIHLMLERLSRPDGPTPARALDELASALDREVDDPELLAWWQEAQAVHAEPRFAPLFDPSHYERAYNEVPIQYRQDTRLVYGIIDRLVITGEGVLLIDYKTHRSASADTLTALALDYREQMRLYAQGVAALWPKHRVRSCLLFTTCKALVEMPASAPAGTRGNS
jgi:ATP-dependent helicase/nuclease subunit A